MLTTTTPRTRRWASINDAAEYVGVNTKTLRRMMARGEITGYRFGDRLLRFDLNELDAANRPVPTSRDAS